MNTSPTTEERIWAIFAHLSAIAFGMGILIPVVGWSEQRRKSKYASFQCLQALGYQSLGYTAWLLAYLLIFIGVLIVLVIRSFQAEKNGQTFDPLADSVTTLIYVTTFGFFALYLLFPVIAAIACALGNEYRYPLLGKRLANYLGYSRTTDDSPWLIEEHEDRWVAAAGHFSVIIALWGLLVPVTAWILQAKRSSFLRFQSTQTILYQVGVTFMFIGATFIASLGLALLPITLWSNSAVNVNSSFEMVGLLFVLVLLSIAAVIILVVPLFHILGQWAGYRVLKGDNYHYPWLGRLVERRMVNKMPLAGIAERHLRDDGLSKEGKSS